MKLLKLNQLCLFLTWFVFVSGSTSDYPITIGETVTMPCHFGEGTVQNIYWYFGDSTGSQQILGLFMGELNVDEHYENRVKLVDNNALVLEGVTVEDEGTYRCDVDRKDDTHIPNLLSQLQVFGLDASASPVITQCMNSGNPHHCEYHVVEDPPIDISCELHNFYPEAVVSLAWYREAGNAISSSSANPTQNNDGTFSIVSSISIYPDGRQRLWCNASFPTVDRMVNKATSVYVINEDTHSKNTKVIVLSVMIPGAILLIAIVLIYWIYTKSRQNSQSEMSYNKVSTSDCSPAIETRVEESEVSYNKGSMSDCSPAIETRVEGMVTQKELLKLSHQIGPQYYSDIAVNLGLQDPSYENTKTENLSNLQGAMFAILKKWNNEEGGGNKADLDQALRESGCGGLIAKYKLTDSTRKAGDGAEAQAASEAQRSTLESTLGPARAEENTIKRPTREAGIGGEGQPESPAQGSTLEAPLGPALAQGNTPKKDSNSQAALPNATGQLPNMSEPMIVTDEMLLSLSELVEDQLYITLAVHLGLRQTLYENIRTENPLNRKDAMFKVLKVWKREGEGKMTELDKALMKSGCGGLVAKYKLHGPTREAGMGGKGQPESPAQGSTLEAPQGPAPAEGNTPKKDSNSQAAAPNAPGQLPSIATALKLTDEQLLEVATKFPSDKYQAFCLHLAGKDLNESQRILKENMHNFEDALIKVMMKWNNTKGSSMSNFKVALEKVDAGGLTLSF